MRAAMLCGVVLLSVCGLAVGQYSAIPATYWSANVGGSGVDAVKGVAAFADGSTYIVGQAGVGSTSLNISTTAGQPLTGKSNLRPYSSFSSFGANGFITKLDAMGIPVWSIALSSINNGDASIDRIVLDNTGSRAFICGSFKEQATLGTYTLNSYVDNIASSDVFAAALHTKNGSVIWAGTAGSDSNEACTFIAYSNADTDATVSAGGGTIMVGGSMTHATGMYDFVDEANNYYFTPQNPNNAKYPQGFLLRVLADGSGFIAAAHPRVLGDPSTATRGGYPTAASFDAYGNLAVASVVYAEVISNPTQFQFGPENTTDALAVIFPTSTLRASPLNSATPAEGTYFESVVGSAGDDFPTGIAIVKSSVDMELFSNDVNVTIALTGWTKGVAGTWFNVSGGVTGQRIEAPVRAQLPAAASGWWIVSDVVRSCRASGGNCGALARLPSVPLRSRFWAGYLPQSMAQDRSAPHFVIGGYHMLTASINEAYVMRIDAAGNTLWSSALTGPYDNRVTQVLLAQGPTLAGLRQRVYFVGTHLGGGWGLLSSSPAGYVPVSAAPDGFVQSIDEYNDCLNNICNVNTEQTTTPPGIGASRCFDDAALPLCLCNMKSNGTFCSSRGWNCKFMLPYYLELLNVCGCEQLATPTPGELGPIQDILPRFTQCAGSVCNFGSYTGSKAQCLPLALDLMNTCSRDPDTPKSDQGNIAAFLGVYSLCNAGPKSSTGPTVFGAANAQAEPVFALVIAAAAVAAAAASRRV